MEYFAYYIVPRIIIPLLFIIFGAICIFNPKIGYDINAGADPNIPKYNKLAHHKQMKIAGILLIIVGIFILIIAN